MTILNPTFGSDPECFVREIETGKIVPCPIEFGGSKDKPLSIGDCGFGECFRQIDGVACEFNIPIVTTLEQWTTAYNYCIEKANEILNPMGLETVSKTSHVFDVDQLTEDRHLEFGCSVSYCAYDWETLQPDSEMAGNMRTTGAHIHVGFKLDEQFGGEVVQRWAYCMDKCVGIPALELDDDIQRRQLYGMAGEYRDKFIDEEGNELTREEAYLAEIVILEYRSIGGKLVDNPEFLFNATQKAIELFNSDYVFTEEEIKNQRNLINHKIKVEEYETV